MCLEACSSDHSFVQNNYSTEVPRPSDRMMTDIQVRKAALVIISSLLVLIPASFLGYTIWIQDIPGIYFSGMGTLFGGVIAGGLLCFQWPRADFQTPDGAAQVRRDLKELSLTGLVSEYELSDLVYYGFLTQQDADQIHSWNNQLWQYIEVSEYPYDSHMSPSYLNTFAMNDNIYQHNQQIEGQFKQMQSGW